LVALTVTPVVVAVAIVVAVNVAELLLAKTVTDAGTVTSVELLERVAVNVAEITTELSVRVQVLDWPPITVAGAQDTPVMEGVG
jgi:hypothetical protein